MWTRGWRRRFEDLYFEIASVTVRDTETLSEFHFSRELFVISTPHLVKVICDFCKVTSELYMVFL